MSWQDNFEAAIKDYFGIPAGAEIFLSEDHDYANDGCPTCGYGDTDEWEVRAAWYEMVPGPRGGKAKKTYRSKVYSGSMLEFIQQLPRN